VYPSRKTLSTAAFALLCGGVSTALQAQSIGDLAATAAGCALISEARASMPVEPLYQRRNGDCVARNPRGSSLVDSLRWFSDDACTVRVPFVPTPMALFCADIANDKVLGTAEDTVPNAWTLNPGTRIDVGARSLEGVPQPYMQRIKYASFPTPSGQCELEMRVYSPHPGATGLASLVALHGGAWRFRGFGYFGLEMTIPHLVAEGFVVYAPFYRLLDDVDGSPGCQNASIVDLTNDAQTALNWVQANASRYGSRGKPIVFGQSAGAHLAASLWLNRRDEVSGAVLLYPPTDFTDFTTRVQSGEYTNEEGIDVLRLVLGTEATVADLSATPIPENSYPQLVASQPEGLAPIFLLHGQADTLVEARQSERLCNAVAGRSIEGAIASDADAQRTVVSCEPENSAAVVASKMHLFALGEHAMDLCIDGGIVTDKACPAGGAASSAVIGESIAEAARFARQAFTALSGPSDDPSDDDVPVSSPSGGGGSLSIVFLFTVLLQSGVLRLRRAYKT